MTALLSIILFFMPLQATSPEEMYSEYITPEVQAVLDESNQLNERLQEEEAARESKKTLFLLISLAVGIVPLIAISKQIISKESWKNNPKGTRKAIAIALLGGVLMFALNYGILTLKQRMADGFNIALAYLLLAALIVGIIYLMKKKG